jgi:hypothetical protein
LNSVTEDTTPTTQADPTVNVVDTLYDFIREVFVSYARQISQTAKVGDQFKMIQQCKELTPEDASQKAVWQLIEQARRDFLNTSRQTDTNPQREDTDEDDAQD